MRTVDLWLRIYISSKRKSLLRRNLTKRSMSFQLSPSTVIHSRREKPIPVRFCAFGNYTYVFRKKKPSGLGYRKRQRERGFGGIRRGWYQGPNNKYFKVTGCDMHQNSSWRTKTEISRSKKYTDGWLYLSVQEKVHNMKIFYSFFGTPTQIFGFFSILGFWTDRFNVNGPGFGGQLFAVKSMRKM